MATTYVWVDPGGWVPASSAGGLVTSVSAADTSVVVGGTASAPTVRTGTLDVIAADHPPAADWSNNSHKITDLAAGVASTDAATVGQITAGGGVTSLDTITGAVSLVAGSNVTITDNSPSAGDITITASGGGGGVTQYDYVEITSPVTITGGSGTQTTVIDGTAVTYDGSTRIMVEFYAPAIGQSATAGNPGTNALIELWDGSTDLGIVVQVDLDAENLGSPGTIAFNLPVYSARFLTPSAGSHTFHIKGWVVAGAPIVRCGAGGANTYLPAWMRITQA